MSSIKITNHFGFIFRKERLVGKSISIDKLSDTVEIDKLEENDSLISFGPCFGDDASKNIMDKLNSLGLEFVEDYFIIDCDLPDWLRLRAEII